MTTEQTDGIWIGLLDQRAGRIVRIRPVPGGHYQCEEHGRIESSWEEHQRGRPSPRSGKSGHSHASIGHEDEEMMRRFARDVAVWLSESVEHFKIAHLDVFSPARFLGELRQTTNHRLSGRVELREGDLASLSDGDLVKHQAVMALWLGDDRRR